MIFTETEISDNRVGHSCDFRSDEIIIGATSTNIFNLWFNFYDYIDQSSESSKDTYCKIIYKQGFDIILDLDYRDPEVTVETFGDLSSITVVLTPEQTSLFKDTILDTFVQLKFLDIEGMTQYTKPMKLKVIKPIDQE